MSKDTVYDLYCPQCQQPARTFHSIFPREYSSRALGLLIFYCSDCRTIGIDRPTVRCLISAWSKGIDLRANGISLKQLDRKYLKELEKMVAVDIYQAGYRRARFRKRQKVGKHSGQVK